MTVWTAVALSHPDLQKVELDKLGNTGVSHLGGRPVGGPNPPGSKTLYGGAGTPGTVKNTEHRAAMPPASEAGVTPTKPKEENGWPRETR